MFPTVKVPLGFPGACCSWVLLPAGGTLRSCTSLLFYLGFHFFILMYQNAGLNVSFMDMLCRSFKACRRRNELLCTCCQKSLSKLQALVASLHLSGMGSIILTLQIDRGTERFPWSGSAQGIEPYALFLPPFLWAPSAQWGLSASSNHPQRSQQE